MNARVLFARVGGRAFGAVQTLTGRSSAHSFARSLELDLPDTDMLLADLLTHAATHVPYWSTRLDPRQNLLPQYQALPPLEKECIRRNEAELRSDDLAERQWWINHSGGSSGMPISIVHDRDLADWAMATSYWYFRHELGIEADEVPNVVLWGSERDLFGERRALGARVRDLLTQTLMLNSFKMDDATMRSHVAALQRVQPVYIKGYAGSLYEIARFAEKEGLLLHQPSFLYSAAETLRPEMREVIERAFRAPVFDFYGSREVGPIAAQGRDGLLHVFGFFNRVEVVAEDGRPVGPGEHGRVLVTTLRNRAMPLLRYELGDTAEVHAVDAGGSATVLRRITGRVTDHFVSSDGGIVHGEYFTHLFYGVPDIVQFQVLQRSVDEVVVYFVAQGDSEPADMTRRDIDAKMRLVLGESCRIQWERVAEIPRTPQGKLLFTRSLVDRGRAR